MNIILIGAQGSGKGTQAQKLVEVYGVQHVSSGDLFRQVAEDGTEIGKEVKAHLDRGELVPDDLTVAMILSHISEPESARKGVLLDGFPRTIVQAQALDEGLARVQRTIDCAIYLQVPYEALIKRLTGRYICRAHQHVYNIYTNPPKVTGICDLDESELHQRSDDQDEEAIHKRLEIFFHESILLLKYYENQGKMIEVDGNQDIEQVEQTMLKALESYLAVKKQNAHQA